ncbi:TNF receptor-associated factor 2 [Oopsacas minuta]|uniref:TNF receptor-associated factor 2 n=1 Tax=Oopsacas minuta TaxID=111878 RepID=A0AAV7K2C6_9METZ|nr:TNF receptor-associated factor 2 [Oopsacas minuta]
MADYEPSSSIEESSVSNILVHRMFHGCIAGYKLELLLHDDIELELVCQLCNGMLNEPLETSCGHAFCSHCIEIYSLQTPGIVICPVTGCCEVLPDISELKAGHILSKLVKKQKFSCPFKGCLWIGQCDEAGQHVASCSQKKPTWEIIQGLAYQVNDLATNNSQLIKTIHSLDREIQSMNNPAFYWKIHHVSNAVYGKSELFSPTFMTGKCGYQACLHVYMGGNSIGKGTHISLYLQLQLGTNNDILPWPVKCKFLISLINFAKDEHHYTQSGKTEFDGTGKGVGYPKFISWRDLQKTEPNKKFLLNNCLILKCTLTSDSHIANLK